MTVTSAGPPAPCAGPGDSPPPAISATATTTIAIPIAAKVDRCVLDTARLSAQCHSKVTRLAGVAGRVHGRDGQPHLGLAAARQVAQRERGLGPAQLDCHTSAALTQVNR